MNGLFHRRQTLFERRDQFGVGGRELERRGLRRIG
jgi:hypothetical protein